MAISFNNPWILLLIPINLYLLYFFSKGLKGLSKFKRNLIYITRLTIITLLIFSLSGLSIKAFDDTISTIFAVDLSDSTKEIQENFKDFINESLQYTNSNDKVGIVAFGESTEIEISLSDNLKSLEFQTLPRKDFTNIQKALSISQALMPENSNKRIILLTDGKENLGNSIDEGSLINFNNIDFKVYNIKEQEKSEIQLSGIDIPRYIHENQIFDVTVEIFSNLKTTASITLYSDRKIVSKREVTLEKGTNKFYFNDTAQTSGFKSYSAVISSPDDNITQNNTFSAFTEIIGKPNILLVDGESNGAGEIEKILRLTGLNITKLKDVELPTSLLELTKYDSIVMCDVSLENVNNGFINSIKNYVRDFGGGLVVTGGQNSFALGGYYKTPLEEVLPVDMEMKVKGEIPSLGLMLVIDKSGSMSSGEGGYSKIELAKDAAIKSLDSLKPKDKIGVIAFDGIPQWVVRLTSIEDKKEIKDNIGTIRASGGTSIIPALQEAYTALKDADTKLKHIILLTDGHAERQGYLQLLDNIKKAGITISTVAVGDGADEILLEAIAKEGRGRYYFVDDYSTIPHIFSKETFLASKSYINNRRFTPYITHSHEVISPLLDGTRVLDGYISTSSKNRGQILLSSDKDEPILAVWQYGLGKSVAWTSDLNGLWSADYLNSDNGVEVIKNMVEWSLPLISNQKLNVESRNIGSLKEITAINTEDFNEDYITKATVISPSNEKREVLLDVQEPGKYTAQIPTDEKGVYIVKVKQYKGDNIINTANYGLAVNYSKEYDFTASENRLNTLVNQAKGEFINNPDEVFTGSFQRNYKIKDLSQTLLIIALLLFIFDIALRRLNLKIKWIDKIRHKILKGKKEEKLITNKIQDAGQSIEQNIDEDKAEKTTIKQKKNNKKNSSENKLNTSRLLGAKAKKRRDE